MTTPHDRLPPSAMLMQLIIGRCIAQCILCHRTSRARRSHEERPANVGGAGARLRWRTRRQCTGCVALLRAQTSSRSTTVKRFSLTPMGECLRRPTCPFIFHSRNCGAPRFRPERLSSAVSRDFEKVWGRACAAIGMAGRIPHDLRRSGVRHCIDARVDPHSVMLWSGHRTESMLRRYHIVDLDDLRRAGKKPRDYRGRKENVIKVDSWGRPPQNRPRTT